MLLDQKRTKRMVQVVAVLTSIAFIGVIFVVVGFIVFGGGDSSQEGDLRSVAEEQIENDPQNPDGYAALATAELQDGNTEAALEAAQQAVELDPSDFDLVQTVVQVQVTSGNAPAAVQTLQTYTQTNPQNPDGFATLGQIADQSGQTALARLAFQRYLQLAPDGVLAADIRARLEGIADGEPPPVPAQAGGGAQHSGG